MAENRDQLLVCHECYADVDGLLVGCGLLYPRAPCWPGTGADGGRSSWLRLLSRSCLLPRSGRQDQRHGPGPSAGTQPPGGRSWSRCARAMSPSPARSSSASPPTRSPGLAPARPIRCPWRGCGSDSCPGTPGGAGTGASSGPGTCAWPWLRSLKALAKGHLGRPIRIGSVSCELARWPGCCLAGVQGWA
jgi:hypothetical protein